MPEAYRTPDTRVDPAGTTYLRVAAPDLDRLVLGRKIEERTKRLTLRTAGLEPFAYTFGA